MENLLETDAIVFENFIELGEDSFDSGEFDLTHPLTSNPDRLGDLFEGVTFSRDGIFAHVS